MDQKSKVKQNGSTIPMRLHFDNKKEGVAYRGFINNRNTHHISLCCTGKNPLSFSIFSLKNPPILLS